MLFSKFLSRQKGLVLSVILLLFIIYHEFNQENNVKPINTDDVQKKLNLESLKSEDLVKPVTSIETTLLLNLKKSPATTKQFKMTFDIELVTRTFQQCHEKNLDISAYVTGYNEIYNFFNVLGTVFGFVASDVKEKLEILKDLQVKNAEPIQTGHYTEVETMMIYEAERNKKSGDELFGSRTLLRLHRALDFTRLFLGNLGKMDDHDKVSTMAGNVYQASLANFHPWLIRKAAGIALYALPTRKDLIKKIAPDGIDEDVLKEKISLCVQNLDVVYMDIEKLYTKHDLHSLP